MLTFFFSPLHAACRLIVGAMWLCAVNLAWADGLTISVADVVAPNFALQGIKLNWAESGVMRINIAELRLPKKVLKNVQLRCGSLAWRGQEVACQRGTLDLLPQVQFELRYQMAQRRLSLTLNAPAQERWQLVAQLRRGEWNIEAHWQNALLTRLAPWLPANLPTVTQGKLTGTLHANGQDKLLHEARLDVAFSELAFGDASGLHAGEKLAGTIKLGATQQDQDWQWQADLAWQSGELFWQPLYLSSGQNGAHEFRATGEFDGETVAVTDALLSVPAVGQMQFAGAWDLNKKTLVNATLRGEHVGLENLFALYTLPYLEKSVLADSKVAGFADVAWEYRDGMTRLFQLDLHDAGIVDSKKRFQLNGLNTLATWKPDVPSTAKLWFDSGEVAGVPLGQVAWEMQMNGLQFNVAEARLPILDGALTMNNLELHRENDAWHWQFGGMLYPISMEKLSVIAGLPKMLGTLGGVIPQVRYENDRIRVAGELVFRVFNGSVGLSGLEFTSPFNPATARMVGNLNMRNLDLGLLTRTFSFGNIEGLIDVDVNHLVLQSWQPLHFEARVASSHGNYRKKISQKAVQNISSLGGSGVAAAIQRSVVGVFENFGYRQIGWSCVLNNDVCNMGGIANQPNSSYTIITGGGIPAINVIGYNHTVSWSELVSRLKRVIQKNRQIIVVK